MTPNQSALDSPPARRDDRPGAVVIAGFVERAALPATTTDEPGAAIRSGPVSSAAC